MLNFKYCNHMGTWLFAWQHIISLTKLLLEVCHIWIEDLMVDIAHHLLWMRGIVLFMLA